MEYEQAKQKLIEKIDSLEVEISFLIQECMDRHIKILIYIMLQIVRRRFNNSVLCDHIGDHTVRNYRGDTLMTINDKKLLDSAHEGNPVYKFLVFYDLLSEWFKDPKLKRFSYYEDIFYHVSKTIEQYEKSDYAKDYTQSELACIIEYLEDKFEHKVAKIWKVQNNLKL